MPPAEERLDAPTLSAAQVDDRLIPERQLTAAERGSKAAGGDLHIGRLARTGGALEIGAGELYDDAARDRTFHAIAASCDRVTRSVRPASWSSRKRCTSAASHCVPAP